VFVQLDNTKHYETCLFQRFMKVDFVKYTMFRSKITTQAELGMLEASKVWFNQAYERGYLTGLPPPPVPVDQPRKTRSRHSVAARESLRKSLRGMGASPFIRAQAGANNN